MEPALYLMAILGCGDAGVACQQVRVEPARYTSVHQCQAAMPAALERNLDVAFPVISAACRRSDQRLVQQEAPRAQG